MGGGSSDSASTRSRDTSERMDERDDEDALAEGQQQRVEAYAQQADDAEDDDASSQSQAPQGDTIGGSEPSNADERPDAAMGGGAEVGLDSDPAGTVPEDDTDEVGNDDSGDTDSFPGFNEFMEGEGDLPDDPADAVGDDADDLLDDIELGGDSDEIDELLSDDQPRTYDDEAAYRAVAVDGAAEIDGEEEFAQEVLHDGTAADRYQPNGAPSSGVDGADSAFPPAEPGSHRFGGWSDYDPDDVARFQLLPNTGAEDGHTAAYMQVGDVDDAGMGTDRAYITHYNEGFRPDVDEDSPDNYYAHRQMVGYAFADSVGAHIPPHTFNRAEDWVAVGGVAGDPVHSCSQEAAKQVDRGELVDQLAIQLTAGNMDLHTSNVFVGTDGHIHCIDMDLTSRQFDTYDDLEEAAGVANEIVEGLNEKRPSSEKLDIDSENIASRAQEIAVSLHVSGEKERVYETLESYDEVFNDYYDKNLHSGPYGGRVKQNIEVLINDARYKI